MKLSEENLRKKFKTAKTYNITFLIFLLISSFISIIIHDFTFNLDSILFIASLLSIIFTVLSNIETPKYTVPLLILSIGMLIIPILSIIPSDSISSFLSSYTSILILFSLLSFNPILIIIALVICIMPLIINLIFAIINIRYSKIRLNEINESSEANEEELETNEIDKPLIKKSNKLIITIVFVVCFITLCIFYVISNTPKNIILSETSPTNNFELEVGNDFWGSGITIYVKNLDSKYSLPKKLLTQDIPQDLLGSTTAGDLSLIWHNGTAILSAKGEIDTYIFTISLNPSTNAFDCTTRISNNKHN